MSDFEGIPQDVEFEVAERPVGAIVGAILLMIGLTALGVVPIFVGLNSERRDPGGGYIIFGALTGLGHLVFGLMMFVEALIVVGTGRGRTIARIAKANWPVHFGATWDFMLGLLAIGFGTVYMFAFTQTIADMPRLPQYALGYTSDGWLGVWIVWVSVLLGCFFWSLWLDAILGRDPVPRRLDAEEGYEEEYSG